VVLEGSPRSSDAGDQVEVLTGSFSVTTDPVSYGFAATAGQCVTVVEVSDPTTGSTFTQCSVDHASDRGGVVRRS